MCMRADQDNHCVLAGMSGDAKTRRPIVTMPTPGVLCVHEYLTVDMREQIERDLESIRMEQIHVCRIDEGR